MRNPIRRNRNIGKTQGGRVKNGRADEKWSRVFPQNLWESISNESGGWRFFAENPSKHYYHPCKPKEYLAVLERLPSHQTEYVKGIILRRVSKRDEKFNVEARRRYSCVILNAFPKKRQYSFDKKPSESTIRHYAPFSSNWTEEDGKWILNWEEEEVKKYYLYHLFLHELGHINEPEYHSKTKRENYAESFARDMAEWLEEI